MRALVTLVGFGLLALAGCLSNDAPAPDGGPPLACAAGGSACPALAGFTVSCEDGACVARSPTADARADCAGDGRYGNDLRFDARNCGACGFVCPGSATCFDGACACAPSEVRCNDVCVSSATSRAHCGGCGNACAAGERCVAGACVACAAGEVACGDRCVRLASDSAHCGGCGRACGGAETCVDGACAACPGAQVACDGVCVDVASDTVNCGRCGTRCAPGFTCAMGQCGPGGSTGCPSDSSACDGRCVHLRVDPAHCGRCDIACPAGVSCVAGRCTCPAGLQLCDGRCVETRNNPLYCGGCFARCTGPCIDGQCYPCAASEICEGRCTEPASDHAHCGGCGRACGASEICAGGRCEACPGGQTFCARADACVDVSSSDAHCGACGAACGARQQCRAGRCVERCDAATSLAHSDANCGACGVVCGAGTFCVDGRCASASPRLQAPISTTLVTSGRPWFRWELPAGADGARVEVCATRACDRVEASWEVTGDRLRAPTAIAPGVHHWRVYARRGGRFDATPSVVWEFVVPGGATALATGAGVPILHDLNGDGVADRAEASASGCPAPSGCFDVRYGRPPTGAPPADQRIVGPPVYMDPDLTSTPTLADALFAPDLDGDGFGELLSVVDIFEIHYPGLGASQRVYLHAGSSSGVFVAGAWFSGGGVPIEALGASLETASVGDRDGDGYGDLAIWRGHPASRSYGERLGGRPSARGGSFSVGSNTPAWIDVGDFDADGRSDLVHGGAYDIAYLSMGAARPLPLSESTEIRGCASGGGAPFTRLLASVSDVNDDGYDDLSTTWYDGGRVLNRSLYLGGPDGLSAARCTPLP